MFPERWDTISNWTWSFVSVPQLKLWDLPHAVSEGMGATISQHQKQKPPPQSVNQWIHEKWSGEHMGFYEHWDTILNWTCLFVNTPQLKLWGLPNAGWEGIPNTENKTSHFNPSINESMHEKRWHRTRSEVVHCLRQFPAILLTPTIHLHAGLTTFYSSA